MRPMGTAAYGGKGQGKGNGRGEGRLGHGGRGRSKGSEKPMGTTAYGGKGSKGRAANGDRPVGAASCRRDHHTMASCQTPPLLLVTSLTRPPWAQATFFLAHPFVQQQYPPMKFWLVTPSRHPQGGRGLNTRRPPARLLTIGCGISCSSFLSLATFAENARSPGKSRFIAILGVFGLETAVASRVTKMAITRL